MWNKCNECCRLLGCFAVGGAMTLPSPALATSVTVYGGPTYDHPTQTGYLAPGLQFSSGSIVGNGVGLGGVSTYSGGTFVGQRAVRWDAFGGAAELGNLGTQWDGFRRSQAYDMNSSGSTVEYAYKYTDGAEFGQRAVRWDNSGAVTELATLGTRLDGFEESRANGINNAGAAVGYAFKYSFLTSFGSRAVRWDASGTITELGNIGTSSGGGTNGLAIGINAAGTAVGAMEKFVGGTNLSYRAVRWDASGTAATELGNLGTDSGGATFNMANVINSAGVAIGFAQKYTAGTHVGPRAVRWDASNTIATELGNLGTGIFSGSTNSNAYDINDAGTIVGYASKYSAGAHVGSRAVRWEAAGTAATELGNLGTDISGTTETEAYAINSAGVAVGYAQKYTGGGTLIGNRAAAWDLEGNALDLNTLIDPSSGWTLMYAVAINDNSWISGIGLFDPDAAGPLAAYNRLFLVDASSVVPEAAGLALLGLGGFIALLRRRPIKSPQSSRFVVPG